jgi:phenylalanine-4-hydroxylase
LYKKSFKKQEERYYIIFLPKLDELAQLTQQDFKKLHQKTSEKPRALDMGRKAAATSVALN